MKQFLLIFVMACLAWPAVFAQDVEDAQSISPENREKWLAEMRNYKHEFLVRELKLDKAQQESFFPVYDQMDDELNRISEETRQLETQVTRDKDASQADLERATKAVYEQKAREGAIEMQYYEKFKQILNPKQLLSLKNAERKFTQQLVRHHGRQRTTGVKRKQ